MPLSSQAPEAGKNIQQMPMNELKIHRYNPLQYAHGNGKMTHPGCVPIPRNDVPGNRNGCLLAKNPVQENEPWIHDESGNGTGKDRVTVHDHHNGLRTDDGSENRTGNCCPTGSVCLNGC